MPGFGLSTPLTKTGVNFWTTADLWHQLMTKVLGFEKYAAQGGDWGGLTTTQLGHKYAGELHGIHISTVSPLTLFNHERPWDRSDEHTSELQSLMRLSYAVFCLKTRTDPDNHRKHP